MLSLATISRNPHCAACQVPTLLSGVGPSAAASRPRRQRLALILTVLGRLRRAVKFIWLRKFSGKRSRRASFVGQSFSDGLFVLVLNGRRLTSIVASGKRACIAWLYTYYIVDYLSACRREISLEDACRRVILHYDNTTGRIYAFVLGGRVISPGKEPDKSTATPL